MRGDSLLLHNRRLLHVETVLAQLGMANVLLDSAALVEIDWRREGCLAAATRAYERASAWLASGRRPDQKVEQVTGRVGCTSAQVATMKVPARAPRVRLGICAGRNSGRIMRGVEQYST